MPFFGNLEPIPTEVFGRHSVSTATSSSVAYDGTRP
jgi:hypothetical protein